jgi:hypothetical protein
MEEKLQESIEVLYKTFARYARPAKIEFCPCGCTKPEDVARLTSVPLRELPFSDLTDYVFSAMTTQGGVDDFRYLLPRLFHGFIEYDYCVNSETIFGKLSYAKWWKWPQDEIQSFRSFLMAVWEVGVSSFPIEKALPNCYEIETLLASISRTGEPLIPYLESWTHHRSWEADQHLLQFVTMHGAGFSNGRTLCEAFWEKAQPQARELRTWLLYPATLQRVRDQAGRLPQDGFEHLFPAALQVLQAESTIICRG